MSRLCGAGVIPFCQHEGKLLFLLAKERYVPHWRGSSRWSGFEGGVKPDEDAIENAVREFCEESICIMNVDAHALKTEIKNNDYAMRVNIVTESRKVSCSMPSLHATFVKKFPYDPDIPRQFEERRKDLMALQQVSESLDMFTRSLPDSVYPFLRDAHRIQTPAGVFVVHEIVSVTLDSNQFATHLILNNVETGEQKKRIIQTHVNERNAAHARAYKTWFDFRSRCEKMLLETSAPKMSYSVVRNPNGTLKALNVFSEFLEKSCVRYWEFEELKQCLRTRPQSSEVFRPYFVLVIKTVLENFSKAEET